MTYQLILVRHGKSVWNVKNIFTGWVDVELDELGISEAKLSGQLISASKLKPTYCFTSFLSRAQKTLEIILSEMNLENIISSLDQDKKYADGHALRVIQLPEALH